MYAIYCLSSSFCLYEYVFIYSKCNRTSRRAIRNDWMQTVFSLSLSLSIGVLYVCSQSYEWHYANTYIYIYLHSNEKLYSMSLIGRVWILFTHLMQARLNTCAPVWVSVYANNMFISYYMHVNPLRRNYANKKKNLISFFFFIILIFI